MSLKDLFGVEDSEVEKAIAGGDTTDLIILKRVIKNFVEQLQTFDRAIGEELVAQMCAAGVTEYPTDEYVARLRTGRTASSISELRLVERGVDAQVIADSRVEGREYVFVEIRKATDRSKVKS